MTDKGRPMEDLGDAAAVKHLRNMVDVLTLNDEFVCPDCNERQSTCDGCSYYTTYTEAIEFLKLMESE